MSVLLSAGRALMGRWLRVGAGCVVASLVLVPEAVPANGHANYRAVCPGSVVGSAHCHAQVVTDTRGNPLAAASPTGYGPAQLHAAYGLPSSSPVAQTIAIVDAYDDPNAERDLAAYDSAYGLPGCTTANGCFKKVNQTGGTGYPRADQGWALEISLDVQTAHQICQNCKILLVEAKSGSFANLVAAEDYGAAHATEISNSYGGSEFSGESSYDAHFDHPGIPITVSSGDNGYGVEYPAASPYVTAVGGTTLTLNPDNTRSGEVVWTGAGSGCSAFEPKPAWQTDAGCANRTVADVSADADPSTGASVYDSYGYQGRKGWFQVGGTSLSAPLIAGVYALAGNGSSTRYGSFSYSSQGSLFDVLSGSNGGCNSYLCNAATGYDGPTGLGTPSGVGGF
jgi:subtilase family serine protease